MKTEENIAFISDLVVERDGLAEELRVLRVDLVTAHRFASEAADEAADRRSADLAGVEAQCAANLDRAEAAEADRERLRLAAQDGYVVYFYGPRPKIVCLCGSTRFYASFAEANLRLTLAGRIVLSIGCDTKSDGDLAVINGLGADPATVKAELDELHRRKIDLCDEVLVVSDETGYFGESTRGEIQYAISTGTPVRFLVSAAEEAWHALAGG